jgi:cell division protein FtsZ
MDAPVSTPNSSPARSNPVLTRSLAIKVVGIGGAGCNAVTHLSREPLHGVGFLVMNTDAASLALSDVSAQLNLGAKTMRGLGAGGDPERGRAAAEEDADRIKELCAGADLVILVAGLGGGTGTGASPLVARIAKESRALVLAFVILPFDCEGSRRSRQASLGLAELKNAADAVITLPNEKVKASADEKTSVLELFRMTNDLVAQGVRSLWRLLEKPGVINVDFADLCSVTKDKHSESLIAIAEVRGENRAREAVNRLLTHPMSDNGLVLSEAGNVLISLASGSSLTMAEVEFVMEQIRRQCEHAHLIMGTAIDEAMGDSLVVTLVASRRHGGVGEGGLRNVESTAPALPSEPDLAQHLVDTSIRSRGTSRCVPPPPAATPEVTDQLLRQQNGPGGRRKNPARWRQGQLPLEIISKGRFEKSEPTIHHGQDLDLPTYIRRGVSLN